MNVRISQRVKELKPSATLAIDAKAKEMIAKGIDVVNLGAGEPDFPTPSLITQAAVSAIHAGFTKYTHVAGLQELKAAIAKGLERDQKVKYDPSTEIIASVGAKHSLYNVFLTLLDTHVSALISAAFLFNFGTGPIRGFAVTLAVGLISNLFTATFVSKTLFELALSGRRQAATLSI